MKKQIVKTLSMSVVILTVVFATAVVSANGQTTERVSAQIPFDFVVGDKTLSAGEYVVSSATQDGAGLLIRKAKTNDAAIRFTHEIAARPKQTHARLVFHRYGQTYFLAEVWQGGNSTGRALAQSKAERALRRERASLAQNSYEKVELVASAR
jgi:hypothetical protein